MRRTYNYKISERANACLKRREAEVRAQKYMIAATLIFFVALGILFGATIHVFAGENQAKKQYKYYTTIRVEEGDTLWDIAADYIGGTGMSRQEYIAEISRINGIRADEIVAGDELVVMYYDTEK